MTATQAGPPAMDPEDGGHGGAGTDQIAFGRADDTSGARDTRAARGDPHAMERIAALRARLMTPMPDDRLWGWLGPLLVTAFAAFTRFYRLSIPRAVVFDETYYAKDAWSILLHGVEWQYVKNPNLNNLIIGGDTHIFAACSGTSCGEYVVQPPVGKLLIAVGEWIYGLTPLGWRLAPAVFGTLAVLVMCRVGRRLTRSTLLGCVAGLLLSLDGLEFVLSRTAILDIFLMFFVLAAFGALLVDRDVSRARLASAMVLTPSDEAGPQLGIRKWRIAAGVLIGLACASKQDALWYLLAFIALAIAWDIGARRAAGLRQYVRGALVRDGKWLPVTLMAIPLGTYIATWTGWMVTSTGYDSNYAQQHGITTPVISQLYSLYEYHKEIYHFMSTLSLHHPYQSQPWDWFVISRPVAFYYESFANAQGTQVCPSSGCKGQTWSSEVLAIGNPAIWWVGTVAILFCLGWWFTRRDWRAGVAVLGVAAGWLPWLPYPSRTKFYYYALEFEPFMILCIVLCLGLLIGPVAASLRRRAIGSALAGTYVLAVLVLFWYFYPILSAKIIPYSQWLSHMWYTGWI
jgi:dolichyl-phosphate-mannose-protein mannosyltransferase